MATVYHRDQAGAPLPSYSSSSGSISHFDSLKTVLKGCLVSGYGSQPAAGWELISEGTSYIVLRNGTRTGYLGLSYSSGTVTVHVSETFMGVASNILQGDGLRTGVASNNSVPHRFGIGFFAYSSDSSAWMVVADERTFCINAVTNNTAGPWVPDAAAAGMLNVLFYAGEDSSGNFIAVGGTSMTSATLSNQRNRFSVAGFTSLRDPSTGLLVDTGELSAHAHGLIDAGRVGSPVLLVPSVDLLRVYWHGAGAFSGYLRGIVVPGMLSRYLPGVVASTLGFVGPFNSRTANTALDLGDGFRYFVPVYFPESTMVLMTNNPEFW
jgi:hypothetical protein